MSKKTFSLGLVLNFSVKTHIKLFELQTPRNVLKHTTPKWGGHIGYFIMLCGPGGWVGISSATDKRPIGALERGTRGKRKAMLYQK